MEKFPFFRECYKYLAEVKWKEGYKYTGMEKGFPNLVPEKSSKKRGI
jgi:hypothetical protein